MKIEMLTQLISDKKEIKELSKKDMFSIRGGGFIPPDPPDEIE